MPRPRRDTAESRSGISLDASAHRRPETNKRRLICFEQFSNWVVSELQISVTEENFPPRHMNSALVGFGKHLFYSGAPKYLFAETINAVIDRYPTYRGLVAAAWNTLKKWEEAEPSERSMVMPAALFRASIALSLLWGWRRFAAAMLLGFHGLLRPSEIFSLRRSHLVLPRDVLSNELIAYVKILHSKTSRFMLRQHARVSDELTVAYLDAVFGDLPQKDFLFNCTGASFRSRWNKLFGFLGIPTVERLCGITPKSLRGSGASWFFHYTEDVAKVLWRGRWQSRKSLEHYLQDVMGQVLLANLSDERRLAVLELSDASSHLLVKALGCTSVHPRGSELEAGC